MIRVIRFFTEALAWLQITASPLLLGLIIGALVYFPQPGPVSLVLGISIAIAGLIVGIVWANRVWRKQGTVSFMSRVNASPDFNKPEGI